MIFVRLLLAFAVVFAAALAAQPHAAAWQASDGLPEGPGKDVVVKACASCHGVEVLIEPPRTAASWVDTIYLMRDFGADIPDDEFKTIADYLIAHLALLEVNKATAEEVGLVFGVDADAAAGIIAYRDQQGGFETIDDLKKAPGLDAAQVDELKPRLIF